MMRRSHGARSAPLLSALEEKAIIDRLAVPKHAARKYPFDLALAAAMTEDWPPPPPPLQTTLPARLAPVQPMVKPSSPASSMGHRGMKSQEWTIGYQADQALVGPWMPPGPRADPSAQRTLCEVLSRPKKLAVRSKSWAGGPKQTAAGLAAHRDMCTRITMLREKEREREMEKERQRERERLARARAEAAAAREPGEPGSTHSEPPASGAGPRAADLRQPERGLLLGAFEHQAEPSFDSSSRREGFEQEFGASPAHRQLGHGMAEGSSSIAGPLGVHRGLVGWQLARVASGGGGAGAEARLE